MDSTVTPGAGGTVKILDSMMAAMGQVTAVGKDGTLSLGKNQPNIQIRTFEHVIYALGPQFRAHRMLMTVQPSEVTLESHERTSQGGYTRHVQLAKVKVTIRVISAEDGSSLESSAYGSSESTGDKALSAAQTVALRIALTQLFVLPTVDADPDLNPASYGTEDTEGPAQGGGQITPEQMKERARSESCSAETINGMMNEARKRGDRALWSELQAIGQERFPNR